MAERRGWSDSERILALDFYCRTPFGRLHSRNPQIIRLAAAVGRTPDAIAMKCCNFASLDPAHRDRGVRGLRNASSADELVYETYTRDLLALSEQASLAAAAFGLPWTAEQSPAEPDREQDGAREQHESGEWLQSATEAIAARRVRVNQRYFRTVVLSTYGSACAVCGLTVSPLLDAAHIVPWSENISQRLDPRNGIAMCALHHRAFDAALVTIDGEGLFRIAPRLKIPDPPEMHAIALLRIDGRIFEKPERFAPDPDALEHHRMRFFRTAG